MDNSVVISEILFILMIVVSPFLIFLLAILLKKYNKRNKKSVFSSPVYFVFELFSEIFLFLVKVFSFLFVGDTKYVDDMKEEIDQYFYKEDEHL